MTLTEDATLTCDECGCPGMSFDIDGANFSHAAHNAGCSKEADHDGA